MSSFRPRTVVAVALVAIAALLGAFGITRTARGLAGPPPAPRPTMLAAAADATDPPTPAATPAPGPVPVPARVAATLAGPVAAPGLGGRLLAVVEDARTGAVLYDHGGATPAPPASTAKLLTAAAILAVLPRSHRFTTRVLDAGDGTIVLVGGGDPTLTGAAPGRPGAYPDAARLSDLAARVRAAAVPVRRIVVDDSLFSGPSVAPSWDRTDIGTSYGGAITALMADGARSSPSAQLRSAQPDLAAGAEFAALLGQPGLPVARGRAPAGARQLGQVGSAPLEELIAQMLQPSDNVIAEVLARQVAVAEHLPASFQGATAAIRQVLARLGVAVGTGMRDGSGLSSADRLRPATVAAVLRLVTGAGPPAAAPLSVIAGALPVAGWCGTLQYRFTSGALAALAGRVRAKTGTLTGVSSLAGLVRDRSGRLLVFAMDADRTRDTPDAEAALDAVVGALSGCGCR